LFIQIESFTPSPNQQGQSITTAALSDFVWSH